MNEELSEQIRQAILKLNERERKILVMRYGLSGQSPMTLEEIGKEFGLSRERIRQIEKEALSKLPWRLQEVFDRIRREIAASRTLQDCRTLQRLVFEGQEDFPQLNASMLASVLIRILADCPLDLQGVQSEGALQDRISEILDQGR